VIVQVTAESSARLVPVTFPLVLSKYAVSLGHDAPERVPFGVFSLGQRHPRAIERMLAGLDELRIPTVRPSRKSDLAPFA
jgi:hypothetical protein